jgi:hypothetical protein
MGKVLLAATSLSWFVDLFFRRSWVRDGQSHILEPRTAAETACTAEKDMNSAIQKVKATNYHRSKSGNMRRAAVSGIVVLFAAIVSIAVIASTNSADEATELLKLLPNGMPDISGIQTQPATKSQIMAQMKKDGLTLDLFKKVLLLLCSPAFVCYLWLLPQ